MRLKNDPLLEQDLVLIYIENKPDFYARVEEIAPDAKPKWWRVKFLALTLPLQMMTWIIDDEQIRGADFTMSGTPIRIEKVVPPQETDEPCAKTETSGGRDEEQEWTQKKARVLSLHRSKRKR